MSFFTRFSSRFQRTTQTAPSEARDTVPTIEGSTFLLQYFKQVLFECPSIGDVQHFLGVVILVDLVNPCVFLPRSRSNSVQPSHVPSAAASLQVVSG
jgi:hypothetical protein